MKYWGPIIVIIAAIVCERAMNWLFKRGFIESIWAYRVYLAIVLFVFSAVWYINNFSN